MEHVLITGGAKGLGSKIAVHLASKGYPIVIQYRSSHEEAEKVVATCRSFGVEAHHIQGNFESFQDIEKFIQRYATQFPKTKHIVNNAGGYYLGSALKTPLTKWEAIFLTNLHLPFMLSKAFSKDIIETKGTITMLGVAGLLQARADSYSSAYTVAKQALWQLTRSLAKELITYGVRVNMVSPGYLENAVDLPEDIKKIPIGHPSTFEEVAEVISFLMAAETITGQNIEVAGGVRL